MKTKIHLKHPCIFGTCLAADVPLILVLGLIFIRFWFLFFFIVDEKGEDVALDAFVFHDFFAFSFLPHIHSFYLK